MPSVADPIAHEEDGVRLREYLGVLRRRKWSIAFISILAVAGALLYAGMTTPIYQATAGVQATITVITPGVGSGGNLSMPTEQQAVTSDPVARCAALLMRQETFRADPTTATIDTDALCSADALRAVTPSGLASRVSVNVPTQSDVLQISYRDPSTKTSQRGAQAFALAYVHSKIVRAQELLDQLRAPVLDAQTSLSKQLTQLNTQLDDAIVSNSGDKVTAAGTEKVQNLSAQRNATQDRLGSISLQLLELDPSHINPPQLILPAKLPTKPVLPNKVLDGALGLFVGLALGIGFAFVRERLDDRLHGRADLEEQTGAPVLAVIPKVPGWRRESESRIVTLDNPASAASEAYRKVRTNLLFAATQRPIKSILVCSATAGEGKSTTTANVAVVLAQSDRRVIALSADLRRPRLHRFFDLVPRRGLSDMLVDGASFGDVVLDPNVPNLRVIASGPVPSRPTELLQSARMRQVLEQLEELADIVVIDTTPLLAVSDALILAPLVDAVLLVVDSENTSRWAVRHAREQLNEVGTPLIGAVFNKYDPSKAKVDRYSYGYYYEAIYAREPREEPKAESPGPSPEKASEPISERVPWPVERPSP